MKTKPLFLLLMGLAFAANAVMPASNDVDKTIAAAELSLPITTARSTAFYGKIAEAPAAAPPLLPLVIFMHGSSGISDAVRDYAKWLSASVGAAVLLPDSMVFPSRITYKSPAPKSVYEEVHALRAAEIAAALRWAKAQPWVDSQRIVLVGTSEGSVAVARYDGGGLAGRILYAWSCEDNYFVEKHQTHILPTEPVLNVISSVDPYFAAASPFNADYKGLTGNCAATLKDNKAATIALIPGAPHTLFNLPQVRDLSRAFLQARFSKP